MKTPRYYYGIDPGTEGAFVVIGSPATISVWNQPRVVAFFDLAPFYFRPETASKRGKATKRLDRYALAEWLRRISRLYPPTLAAIETQIVIPGQSVSSDALRLRSHGVLQGLTAALGWPVIEPSPATWKDAMGLSASKAQSGLAVARLFAQSLHWLSGPRGGLLDGRAEAALLAEYARTLTEGDRPKR